MRGRTASLRTAALLVLGVCVSTALGAERYVSRQSRPYNGSHAGENLAQIAFPLGGIGAGMICFEGNGCLSHVSIRHQPEIFHEPKTFAAIHVKGENAVSRVVEGPVPGYKVLLPRGGAWNSSGNGAGGATYGLPRFRDAAFRGRFPFATLKLADANTPLAVELTAWSPFTPPEPDDSSLPVASLEYRFSNTSNEPVEAVFSFHSANFVDIGGGGEYVRPIDGGFVLGQTASDDQPWRASALAVWCDHPETKVDAAWFRGGWYDTMTMVWKAVSNGDVIERPPHESGAMSGGASLYTPFKLAPGEEKTIRLLMAWYTPRSNVRNGSRSNDQQQAWPGPECCPGGDCCPLDAPPEHYVPWYATRFKDVDDVLAYWRGDYDRLKEASETFRDCFFDTTLPPEVVEAVAANLSILKSPTCLRQHDGAFWGWEGCRDTDGCCAGSCTHVWNYAQSLPHLFPCLERSMREATLASSQDERGHQTFRTPLPIGAAGHDFHAAADGQLGNVMRVYREWRIGGDTEWMLRRWPRAKRSLDYCIEAWDPEHEGVLREPHHNTYDIEFWGPDGMCTSMYLGALEAAARMGEAAGEDVSFYKKLAEQGRAFMESELYDGEYFIQKILFEGLRAGDPTKMQGIHSNYSPEARRLLAEEGPKYQYGSGCLSDGVLGAWIAEVCGLGPILDEEKVRSHLAAVHAYNFRRSLSGHANPQRPTFALNDEGGLLLCSWPKGGELSLPFVYSNEVWTGIEYQVASHLIVMGRVEEGLDIVRACRDRYDGGIRNPFSEIECGHFYARAMASYGLLQAMSGARYDAVEKTLYLDPAIDGDFRAFLSTATGFGSVGVRDGRPFVDVASGSIDVQRVEFVQR